MYPYPPPKSSGGFARGIFLTLATTIFGLSLALNAYLLFLSGVLNGLGSRTEVIEEGDLTEKVAVVPLTGVIMDSLARQFDKYMDDIEKDGTIKAIVIEIDSPGGTVTASDVIYHRVQQFKLKYPDKPVVISMGGLAASGGYYVACAGDHIFAQRTTMTGSIGVLWQNFNISKMLDKWGVEDTSIHSTGADFKEVGSPTKPLKPEDGKYIQNIIDHAFDDFKRIVIEARKTSLKSPIEEVANGKIFTSQEALKSGLIDAVGYLDNATQHAAGMAKLKNPTIVRYLTPPSLLSMLGAQGAGAIGESAPGVSSNGGISLNIDANMIHDVLAPQVLYLWNGR